MHRPTRTPQSPTEHLTTALASGDGDHLDAVAKLASAAGFSDEQVEQGKQSVFEGVGTIDTNVVVRTLPVETVRKLLPPGLELAPQPLSFPEEHPVFFLFSHDHFTAWFGTMDYEELMVGVPYVQLADVHAPNRGPFIYMPRLYLNDNLPRILGNRIYGFEKLEADITNDDGTYRVTQPGTSEPIVTAKFQTVGSAGPVTSLPNFETVRRIFEQPTVSQALRIIDPDAFHDQGLLSPFLCSTITYDFATAKITPIKAEVSISDQLTPPGLPIGSFERPSLADDTLGSFRLQAKQVVSLPGSCGATRFEGTPGRKQRVVVLGGGPSACAAAFYLAKQTDRYDVELYTQGWRLGGKCAAGRRVDPPNRIEEHGLHAFIGFYNNAIRAAKDVYECAEIPIARGVEPFDYDKGEGPIANAFLGVSNVGVMEKWKGEWTYFRTPQKFNGEVPGTIPADGEDRPPHFGDLIATTLRHVASQSTALIGLHDGASDQLGQHLEEQKKHPIWDEFVDHVKGFLHLEESGLENALDRLVNYLEDVAIERIAQDIERGSIFFKGVSWLLGVIRGALKIVFKKQIEEHSETWFMWAGVDTLLTALIGLIDARVVDFSKLDDHDFRAWLLDNGLDPRNAQISAINEVYEALFAHNPKEPIPDLIGAGVGLRWFMLVGFLYRGYAAYDFKYSCPQTLLTPYYLALQKLGAKVHFFHRVEDISVTGSGSARTLTSVKMQVQATVKGKASHEYDPFLRGVPGNPDDQPPWPLDPNYDQLEQGAELRSRGIDLENYWSDWEGAGECTLEQGKDFDVCILGIPLAALPALTEDLLSPDSESYCSQWREMVDGIAVTRTISSQLWFKSPSDKLLAQPIGLMTDFATPEPSFADFTHLIQWENWTEANKPSFLAYHTGSLVAISAREGAPNANADYPLTETRKWKEMFAGWLRESYSGLYSRAENFEVLLDDLVTPEPADGIERLYQQSFNISVQPSDLYILSQPKSMELRLSQAGSRVQHLFLCGDWTATDLNCGCVEASTQSGMLAARVLSNSPTYIWHPGF